MNWDNLFFKISADNEDHLNLLREFNQLNLARKVCLTPYDLGDIDSNVQIEEFSVKNEMNNYSKYFDFVLWLNEGVLKRK